MKNKILIKIQNLQMMIFLMRMRSWEEKWKNGKKELRSWRENMS